MPAPISTRCAPGSTPHCSQDEDGSFSELICAAARDPEVRAIFAELLQAQSLPANEKDAIWRAFQDAATGTASAEPSRQRR